MDVDCSELDIHELFQIVNLAERYNIDRLKEEMKNQMEILSIPMENLMEAVAMASKFSNFEASSSALMLNCAKVFQKKIPGMAEQFQFMQDQHLRGNGLLALELLALVRTLPALEPCENCNEVEICLRGLPVEKEKFREGLKVKLSDAEVWNGVGDKRFKIAALLGNQVRLMEVGTPSFFFDATPLGMGGRLTNGATLCYNC